MVWIEEDLKDHLVLPPVLWSGTQIGCSKPYPALANTDLEPFKYAQCLPLGCQKPCARAEEWLNSTFCRILKENSNSLWGNTAVFLCWCRCFAAAHHVRSSGNLQAKEYWHVLVLSFCRFPKTNHREWVRNVPVWKAKGAVCGAPNASVFRCCHQADRHSRRLRLTVRTSFRKRKVDGEAKSKTAFSLQASCYKNIFCLIKTSH